MNSRECVLAALRREKPAWVPTFEWLVDRRVREAFCPGGDELDFVERAGWDAVVVYADDHPDTDGKSQYVDEWGLTVRRATEEYPVVVGHRLESAEDLDSFMPPNPLAEWHFRSLRKAVERFGGEKAIVFRLRDAYSLPRYLVGMENLMILMAGEPEFVQKADRHGGGLLHCDGAACLPLWASTFSGPATTTATIAARSWGRSGGGRCVCRG